MDNSCRVGCFIGSNCCSRSGPAGAQDIAPTTDPDQARIFNVPENTVNVDTISYTRGDPRDRIIFWTLGGADAADFTIEGGALKFGNEPDFENPTDRANDEIGNGLVEEVGRVTQSDALANNTYKVTVRFGEGGQDARPGGKDLYEYDDLTEIEVTVNVRDVDEGGTVVLSPLQPQVETILTATLVEEDFVTPGSGQWQWARHDAPANGSKPAEELPQLGGHPESVPRCHLPAHTRRPGQVPAGHCAVLGTPRGLKPRQRWP